MINIFFGILSLLFLFFIWLTWNNDYWLKKRIPYVDPSFFFGNVRDVVLMKRTMGDVYKGIYKKLHGKGIGGFFKLRQPILMARSPDVIRQVLQDKFDCFADNDVNVRSDTEPILKMNPYLAKGSQWKPIRTMVEGSLKTTNMDSLVQLMGVVCNRMINFIQSKSYHPVNIEELSGRFTTDIFASCCFGKEVNSFSGDPEFRKMTKRLFNSGVRNNLAVLFAFYAPFLGNLFKFRIVGKRLANFYINIVTQICKQRVTDITKRNDFLQGLIDINQESQAIGEGQVYSFEQIAGHCLAMLVDGYYPVAESLTLCLHELAKDQNAQRKAREAVLAITSRHDFLTYSDVNKNLKYLDLVIKESNRLHPPIDTITRMCTKDTKIAADGLEYEIQAGTPVTVPVSALHMDPEYFSDPEKFKPDRFLEEPKPYTYLPHGAGPRTCPGSEFSNILMKMALSSILTNYTILPRDDSPITLDPQNSFLRTPKGGVWVNFTQI